MRDQAQVAARAATDKPEVAMLSRQLAMLGIIDPRDTRSMVAICLSAACNAPVAGTTSWGVFRH